MDALLEDPMTGDKAVSVAGHIKNLHRRMKRSKAFRQYAPVYSGHHYVRKQQMNGAGVLRGYLLGFRSVRCRQDLISVFLEKQLRQQPQRFRVFYQQDGLRSTDSQWLRAALTWGCDGLFDTRQVNLEYSSLSFLRFNGDVAIALFHHAINSGETQSRSLVSSLGGEKRFENLRLGFRVHPCASIRDGQHYVLARDRTRMFPHKSGIEFHVGCLDCQFAPIRHCITRVTTPSTKLMTLFKWRRIGRDVRENSSSPTLVE